MLNFFFELGMLKRVKHEGARLAGIPAPDSIADHSLRAAIIAYILANEEGGDPLRCAMMCVLHDMPECRVGDQHKVAARYMNVADAVETKTAKQWVAELQNADPFAWWRDLKKMTYKKL